jgi:hypothetical protein
MQSSKCILQKKSRERIERKKKIEGLAKREEESRAQKAAVKK